MPRGRAFALTLAASVLSACGGEKDRGTGATTSRPAAQPASAPDRQPARRGVDRLTLRQQVGQLVVLSFRGRPPPAYVHSILADRTAAGVVLFGENVESAPQLQALTGALQRAAGGSALVCTDQEGGAVRIVRFAGSSTGQPEQGTPARARAAARVTARDLHGLGINVNLAPVADVVAGGSAVGGRAFPGGAAEVAGLVDAAVRAYSPERVAPAPKHFPGFGAATSNTDDGPVTIRTSAAELRARDLLPFRAAVAAGAPLVMASHVLYPALDRSRIASQSPVILDRVLRGELGYRGAVITDSIEADAVLRRSSVEEAAVRAVEAGSDLVLMTGPGSYPRIYRRLYAEARRSFQFRARVREAAARVLELKRGLGLQPP